MPRFMLTYTPESSIRELRASCCSASRIRKTSHTDDEGCWTLSWRTYYPQASIKFRRLEIGPSPPAKIEARFHRSRPGGACATWRFRPKKFSAQIYNAVGIRDDWRERSKMIRPQLNEGVSQTFGNHPSAISTMHCSRSFDGASMSGCTAREHNLIPIVVHACRTRNASVSIDSIHDVQTVE